LMVSLATDILTQPLGDNRERHAEYASRIGHLHMLIYAPRGVGTQPVQITDRFTAYPSGSRSRYLFPFDAYRAGAGICRSERIDVISTQDPFTTGLVGAWLKQQHGIPLQVNNHSTFFGNPYWLAESPIRHRAFEPLGRWVVRQADTLRTVNADQRERYIQMGVGPERIEVINTPINLDRFVEPPDQAQLATLHEQLSIPPDGRVILWVGRPIAIKRVPDLLEAFALVRGDHPGAYLVLVGDMSGAPEIARHVARLDLEEFVRCPGAVAHADLPTYYALCDVFVLSSVYEGMPKVIAEASVSGTPVVATRIPAVEGVVLDGDTGLLCERENPPDLAGKLKALLSDPARAAQMGLRGREYALKRFDRERTFEAIVGLWERAASTDRQAG
jgi:glycosyltransferase involved in cell wall biosynthesis